MKALPVRPALATLLMLSSLALFAAGCAGDDASPSADAPSPGVSEAAVPTVENKADSVAMQLYEAMGGPEVWARLPYLRFNFAVDRGSGEQVVTRHLWDRRTGAYRMEWSPGQDTARYVALFNVNGGPDSLRGEVYRSGSAVASARSDTLLQEAYGRHINDTYWLLAPVKLFDPGVNRAYVADSSTADANVLRISFGDVGLTPGDRYWFYVDKQTGRLAKWAFILEGSEPGSTAHPFEWTDYQGIDSPVGRAVVAIRKQATGASSAILTNAVEMPTEVADSLFESPQPALDRPSDDRRVAETREAAEPQ